MSKLEGNYKGITWRKTGFWSLDKAFTNGDSMGFPMTVVEVFGFAGVGKSTFCTSLAGILLNESTQDIAYAPIEHVDKDLIKRILDSNGFNNTVSILGEKDMVKKFLPHLKVDRVDDSVILDCLIESSLREEYGAGILDSLSAISPIEEMESSVTEANMGRRARLINPAVRKVIHNIRFRETPYVFFIISHKRTPMGGGTPSNTGTPTTGGEGKTNLAKLRIGIRRITEEGMERDSKGNALKYGAMVFEGKVDKNNFGIEDEKFFVACLKGKGLHPGLTAVYECKRWKLATFGRSVTLGGKKYGHISELVEKAYLEENEIFEPFIDALSNPSKYGKAEGDDESEFDKLGMEKEEPL